VQVRKRRRSIGAQSALGRGRRSPDGLDAVLLGLIERVTGRLRKARRVCRTVVLRLRFDDFTRATRSHTMGEATAQTPTILATARALLTTAIPMIQERGITLLGVSLSGLDDGATQLEMPVDGHSPSALDATIDDVRNRFGSAAITRAGQLGRDNGPTVPLLED
jgi:DNA polymerase-4